ncbi:MAG: 16S rRNA (cytidine(1402)-2'-O)-methyltransferase [Pseudomonadota bacterium]
MSNRIGCLYVVATPIGNLSDVSQRAIVTLESVDLIAAEDTRHTLKLLNHLGIETPLTSLHDHNERQKFTNLLKRLQQGKDIALVSDAGTPLISDPGYFLVSNAIAEGISVLPIPGPTAAITALSVSGLATDRFVFLGFLPQKSAARQTLLDSVKNEKGSLIFYLSVHKVHQDLKTIGDCLGWQRQVCLAREMTKKFEQYRHGSLKQIHDAIESGEETNKGEFVLVVAGTSDATGDTVEITLDDLLYELLDHLSVKQSVKAAVALTGLRRNHVYQKAQEIAAKKA